MEIGARSCLDQGCLCVYVSQHTGRWGLLKFALAALFGRLQQARGLEHLRTRELRIDTHESRMQELFALTGTGNGAVQRELRRIQATGLVTSTSLRGRKYFQANASHPLHAELAALVRNSFGMAEPLRDAFAGLEYCAELLFAYHPEDAWPSAAPCMDVVLVLKRGFASPCGRDVLDALDAAEQRLDRGFTLTRIVEPQALATPDAFLNRALARPRIWVFGHETRLAGMTSGP